MSVSILDVDEKMFEVYTEIQVTVYVDNSVLLKENYSPDAKIVNVRDRISSVDTCLERNGMYIKERYDEKRNKNIRQNKTSYNRPVKTKTPSTNIARPTDDCQFGISTDEKRTSVNAKVCVSCSQELCVKNVDSKTSNNQSSTQEKHNKCSPVHKSSNVSAYCIEYCSKLPPLQNLSNDLENETSDYDEASSGFFSDDEIEDDALIRRKHLEVNEQLNSFYDKTTAKQITNNSKQSTSDLNKKWNTKAEYHSSGIDKPPSTFTEYQDKTENRNNKRDRSGIETLKHKTAKKCTNDLTNALDKIENGSRLLQTPNSTISCVRELESIEPNGNVTADTNCGLQDKECHGLSTKLVTKYYVSNQLTRDTYFINSNEVPSSPSTKCKEKNSFHLISDGHKVLKEPKLTTEHDNSSKLFKNKKKNISSTSSGKNKTLQLSNVEDSTEKAEHISDNDSSKYFKERSSEELKIPIDKNTAKIESNKSRFDKIPNVYDEQPPSKACTAEIVAMDTENELEPGEIPDDVEISSHASHNEEKLFDYPKYSRKRHFDKELQSIPGGYRGRYSCRRVGSFPPKMIYRKSHDYRWEDNTDERQTIGTRYNNTLSRRDDLRNYIHSTETRHYKFAYEQRFKPIPYRPRYPPIPYRTKFLSIPDHAKTRPVPYSARYKYYKPRPPRRQLESERHRAIVRMRRENGSVDTCPTQIWDTEKEQSSRYYYPSSQNDETDWMEHCEEEQSTDKKDVTGSKTTKFKNFKITRSFSDGDREESDLKRECADILDTTTDKTTLDSTISGNISHHLKLYRSHSETNSDRNHHKHEKRISKEKNKRKSSKDRGKSHEKSIHKKGELSKHRGTSSKRHKSAEKTDDEGEISSKRKRSLSTERRMATPREHDSIIARHYNEEKISSVVTVVSSDDSNSTDITVNDEQQNDTRSKCIVKNKEAHLKCFELIRDFAFKKAVRHSDSNWDKYSKRKFLFEDELIQQLERNFDRYLYSADVKQSSCSGPLPRFVSDELMTTAMVSTWKEPQIVASCDRQFREFDEIIGYVGYNIPCYWCEIIFADGKFVRAFPVLDPIGHRDDTMYCQTDN